MKIFSGKQLYEADKFTIEKQNISGEALMERASLQLFHWLHHRLQGSPVTIRLFCGIGNNGGDGLALARHLLQHGYAIVVYVVNYSKKRSEDFLTNLDRLKDLKVWPVYLSEDTELPSIEKGDILVDAIFGLGLNRPPEAWVGKIIAHINKADALRISVDLPSGLYTDMHTAHDRVVEAHVVLTLQVPKLPFFLPETGKYAEQWEVLDIGLETSFLEKLETPYELITKDEALLRYRPRKKFTHKGSYGHSLIIGGSYGKMGAVQLSARACLKSGSGLVTAYIPKCGYGALQTALPELMVLTDSSEQWLASIKFEVNADVVGLGIGMGTRKESAAALEAFLDTYSGPLVIDADGINILSANQHLLSKLPSKTILTPHPGELKRLIGSWEGDFDKLEKARKFSSKYNCILLIKGAHSITVCKDKWYINSSGNPGMATAGSGDVLTGCITALLAQGYPAEDAAILGVFLHGLAGDIAASHLGYEAVIAGDIIDAIGLAFLELISEDSEEGETLNGTNENKRNSPQ